MAGILVSVGKEASAEVVNVLNQYGPVGMISPELFAIKTEEPIDTICAKIAAAFPAVSHILVAEVSDTTFQGDGRISLAASLLRE